MNGVGIKKKILILIPIVVILLTVGVFTALHFINKGTRVVTFYSDDGKVLKVEQVKRNEPAEPPAEPVLGYGKLFTGWNSDFSKVKKNMNVRAICENVSQKSNAIAAPAVYGSKDGYVFIPLRLCGSVRVSGFDLTIAYDAGKLKLDSIFDADDDVVYNDKRPGEIRLNFASPQNVEGDVDVCVFKFKLTDKFERTTVKITVNSICAFGEGETIITPEYNKYDSVVYQIPGRIYAGEE